MTLSLAVQLLLGGRLALEALRCKGLTHLCLDLFQSTNTMCLVTETESYGLLLVVSGHRCRRYVAIERRELGRRRGRAMLMLIMSYGLGASRLGKQ